LHSFKFVSTIIVYMIFVKNKLNVVSLSWFVELND